MHKKSSCKDFHTCEVFGMFVWVLQATKKVSDAKLAKDFQAVLVEFQNVQRIAQEREKMFIPFVAQAVLPTR
jgi:hypothetical protein